MGMPKKVLLLNDYCQVLLLSQFRNCQNTKFAKQRDETSLPKYHYWYIVEFVMKPPINGCSFRIFFQDWTNLGGISSLKSALGRNWKEIFWSSRFVTIIHKYVHLFMHFPKCLNFQVILLPLFFQQIYICWNQIIFAQVL